MTNKFYTAVLAGTAMLVAGTTAANAATATADAKAKILKQVTVTKAADLNFGTIAVGTTAGTVGISTAGVRSCAAALSCSGTVSAAAFNITGSKSELVNISSDTSVSLNTTPASTAMVASLSLSAASATLSAAAGTSSFNVGGNLSVAASQPDGAYSGTFNVTVDYP